MNKGFQILDKEGTSIPIDDLDREVCEIVGREYSETNYCILGRESDFKNRIDFVFNTYNWFDTIGWLIADKGFTFKEIIEYYSEPFQDVIGKKRIDDRYITIDDIYPYHMKVIRTWIKKGYTTKQVD